MSEQVIARENFHRTDPNFSQNHLGDTPALGVFNTQNLGKNGGSFHLKKIYKFIYYLSYINFFKLYIFINYFNMFFISCIQGQSMEWHCWNRQGSGWHWWAAVLGLRLAVNPWIRVGTGHEGKGIRWWTGQSDRGTEWPRDSGGAAISDGSQEPPTTWCSLVYEAGACSQICISCDSSKCT